MPDQNSIDSNVTGLSVAEETSPKVVADDTVWTQLEPNTYGDTGATYTSVARTPINPSRQQKKGTITDLDVKAGFNTDLTQRNLSRYLQGFFFADVHEKPSTQPINGVQHVLTGVTAGSYTAAAGLDQFLTGHIVVAKNLAVAGNNGIAVVSGVAAGELTVAKGLTVDAAPGAAAVLEAVGFEFPAGDLALTVVGGRVRLTSAAVDLTTLLLNVGEWIYVGGDGAGTRYATAADRGYGRIAAIFAGHIELDLTTFTAANDAGAGQTIRIFFGKFFRNEDDKTLIKSRSYQFERTLGNDADGVQAEYIKGCFANEITVNFPQANKITVDMSFVGMDTENRSGLQGLKLGTRMPGLNEAAFNTTHDLYSSRLAIVDPTTSNPVGLFGFATDGKITVNNQVVPNKALGTFGAFGTSSGNFEVSGTLTVYFSTLRAVQAIRDNADLSLNFILAKQNAGIVYDIPLTSLGGGGLKIEKDRPITMDLTQTASENAFGYTFGVTNFEYLPTIAMPV
jgi:Phage tail tube protein